MADDSYYFPKDDEPAVRGGPPAVGSQGAPKTGLAKQYGPLPLWGWIAVSIAGVILYKKVYLGSGSSSSGGGSTDVPSSSPGGVFLLPQSGGGSAPSSGLSLSSDAITAEQNLASYNAQHPSNQPLTQAGQDFLRNLSAQPDEANIANFFQQNAAAKQLGLPYFTGQGQQIYDPRNNQYFTYSPPSTTGASS